MRHASDRANLAQALCCSRYRSVGKRAAFCQGGGQKGWSVPKKKSEAQDVTDLRVGGRLRVACHTVGVSASDLEPQCPEKDLAGT